MKSLEVKPAGIQTPRRYINGTGETGGNKPAQSVPRKAAPKTKEVLVLPDDTVEAMISWTEVCTVTTESHVVTVHEHGSHSVMDVLREVLSPDSKVVSISQCAIILQARRYPRNGIRTCLPYFTAPSSAV